MITVVPAAKSITCRLPKSWSHHQDVSYPAIVSWWNCASHNHDCLPDQWQINCIWEADYFLGIWFFKKKPFQIIKMWHYLDSLIPVVMKNYALWKNIWWVFLWLKYLVTKNGFSIFIRFCFCDSAWRWIGVLCIDIIMDLWEKQSS